MRRSEIWLYVALGLAVHAGARAGVLDAPGSDLVVSLVTYGPGAIYWERFGHDAIRMRDRTSGESEDFNYGVFDFEDSAFIWNFARGHMRYMIDAESSQTDQQDYMDEGRSVLEQQLALSPAQAANLRAFLAWNLRPEHLSYDYDYLTSNCATRIRDVLNSVLGGALQPILTGRPAPLTYRQQIDRLMRPRLWLMLGMDFGLGPSADHPLNEWQESFLPMVLAREISTVRIPDDGGGVKPLVASALQTAPNRVTPPDPMPPNLDVPLGLAGLGLAVTMLALRLRLPTLCAALSVAYLVIAGIAGTVLLALWTLTAHHAAWANANLLVFNPLAFALLIPVWRARYGVLYRRRAWLLLALQIAAAFLALLLHILPGATQQNLPWLLFAIPVWLAVTVGVTSPVTNSRPTKTIRRRIEHPGS